MSTFPFSFSSLVLVASRHQFHSPVGRWFLRVRMWPPTYATTQPPVSHMLPQYIPRWLPTPPNLDTSQAPPRPKLNNSIKAPSYQPRSAAVPYRTSPRCPPTLLSTFDRAPDPTLRSLSMGASLLSPSPISTLHCNIISVRVVSLPRVLGSLNHTI